MYIQITKNKDYSLQFKDQGEAEVFFKPLRERAPKEVHDLATKLFNGLSNQYAHDDIQLTTLLFSDQVPILLPWLWFEYADQFTTTLDGYAESESTQSSWWHLFKGKKA